MENREPRLFMKGGHWYVKYYVRAGEGYRRMRLSLKTADEAEARKRLAEVVYRQSEGTFQPPSRTFLERFFAEYREYMRLNLASTSYEVDLGYLDKFIAWLPKRITRLEDIDTPLVLKYLTTMTAERRWKPKTWNNVRNVLCGLFKYAIKYHRFVSSDPRSPNPAAAVEKRRVPKSQIRFLTKDQIVGQLDALKPHVEMRAMVATFIFAGLRREELTWLTVDDVDLASGNIRITSKDIGGESWAAKTNSDRRVPISPDLMPLLRVYEAWRRKHHADCVWYFPSPQGCRWDPDNLSFDLRLLQKKYGQGYDDGVKLKPWGCLEFRHTFATQLAARGTTLDKVAKMMGNSVLICERHYAAFVTEDMTAEVNMGVFASKPEAKEARILRIPKRA